MARKKVPGIYMITLPDGKIYIGSSKDLMNRIKRYKWASKSNSDYSETMRHVTKAIRKFGFENCRFDIIDCGDKYADNQYRLAVESEYILKFNSFNPDIGYNMTDATNPAEAGYGPSHVQTPGEKLRRAKPVFLFNYKTEQTFYVFGGAKSAGKFFGYEKDVASHVVNRALLVNKEWYIIPAIQPSLDKVVTKAKAKNTYGSRQYLKAVERIVDIAKEYYGITLNANI